MPIKEISERISGKFVEKGIEINKASVETQLDRLINEFCVNPAEAERAVLSDLSREYQVDVISTANAGTGEVVRSINLVRAGEWVSIEGRVVSLEDVRSDAIAQSGTLADETGAIRYVIWSKSGKEILKEGKWYRISHAVADEFKGAVSLKVHSGTEIEEIDGRILPIPVPVPLAELKPGIATVRIKLVQEWEPRHERILQTGIVGDESGTVKFTIWKDGSPEQETLKPDVVYEIYYAPVDEYQGRCSVTLRDGMFMEVDGSIEVGTLKQSFSGAIIQISPGSGLIRRCPVEGCKRMLSRQNYCPVHEHQEKFIYDLRLKAVLDNGISALNIIVRKDALEKVSGITLDEAISIAESSPIGLEEIMEKLSKAIIGRYMVCTGSEFDNRLIVDECIPMAFDSARLASLINAAAEGGDL